MKSICHEVAVISHGRLIEQGQVGEIFANPQHTLTREFIASAFHVEIPISYQARLSASYRENADILMKLQPTAQSVNEPILSEASRLFGIDFKIVSAQVDHVGDHNFGVILIELSATPDTREKVMTYFRDKHIHSEIVGYV